MKKDLQLAAFLGLSDTGFVVGCYVGLSVTGHGVGDPVGSGKGEDVIVGTVGSAVLGTCAYVGCLEGQFVT